jgi:hypothetical protein
MTNNFPQFSLLNAGTQLISQNTLASNLVLGGYTTLSNGTYNLTPSGSNLITRVDKILSTLVSAGVLTKSITDNVEIYTMTLSSNNLVTQIGTNGSNIANNTGNIATITGQLATVNATLKDLGIFSTDYTELTGAAAYNIVTMYNLLQKIRDANIAAGLITSASPPVTTSFALNLPTKIATMQGISHGSIPLPPFVDSMQGYFVGNKRFFCCYDLSNGATVSNWYPAYTKGISQFSCFVGTGAAYPTLKTSTLPGIDFELDTTTAGLLGTNTNIGGTNSVLSSFTLCVLVKLTTTFPNLPEIGTVIGMQNGYEAGTFPSMNLNNTLGYACLSGPNGVLSATVSNNNTGYPGVSSPPNPAQDVIKPLVAGQYYLLSMTYGRNWRVASNYTLTTSTTNGIMYATYGTNTTNPTKGGATQVGLWINGNLCGMSLVTGVNGSSIYSSLGCNATSNAADLNTAGKNASGRFNGTIAAFAIYNRELIEDEMLVVKNYFATTYNLTLT